MDTKRQSSGVQEFRMGGPGELQAKRLTKAYTKGQRRSLGSARFELRPPELLQLLELLNSFEVLLRGRNAESGSY
jgi:hypothetical protein